MLLSIVSPVYMAQNIVEALVAQITDAAQQITDDFEIVLVEDGSLDNSWQEIEKAAIENKHVKGIQLSRNFGQQFAITAGLSRAKGNYVVVMDCDLQDDPKYIIDLYSKILEGYEIVFTEKEKREHSFIKNITSSLFFYVYNYLADDKFSKGTTAVGNFSILSRKALTAFLTFNDYKRQYLSILRWIGFKHTAIKVVHKKRYEGKTSYTFLKMCTLALDAVISQSDKLLRLTVGFGFLLSFISFLSVIGIVIRYLFEPFAPGWASLATLIIFTGGIIVLCVGICGIYIGKTFEQTKNRPMYIIDKTVNVEIVD